MKRAKRRENLGDDKSILKDISAIKGVRKSVMFSDAMVIKSQTVRNFIKPLEGDFRSNVETKFKWPATNNRRPRFEVQD